MEKSPEQPQNQQAKETKKIVAWAMMEAGIEFALLLAIPLLAGIYFGKTLDAKYHAHFFVIIGILLGLAISWAGIFKRIKDYKKLLK